MAQIQGLLGASFDWRAIDIIFKRNIPTDLSGLADIINKLSNIVSTETLLGQLPFVEDIQKLVFPHPTVCEVIRESMFM